MAPRFGELEAAKAWGIAPHVWDRMPENSRAEIVAFERSKAGMQAYEDDLAERKRLSDQSKANLK